MFQKPFSFEGRIRRSEYGISVIIYIVVALIINVIGATGKGAAVIFIAYIPLLWFLWAQGAKRCHDRGNSGWYQIIPFYVFWMLFADSNNWINEYGLNPKGIGNQEMKKAEQIISPNVQSTNTAFKADHSAQVVLQPDSIGLRFDISKVDDSKCGYGEACWKIFWQAVDLKILAGAILRDGDSNATLEHNENVYCLSITWPTSGRASDVRKMLEKFEPYKQVAANPNFIDAGQLVKEPLVDDGMIDLAGHFVSKSYRALPALEKVQKENQQEQLKSYSESVTNLQGFDIKTDMKCERCSKSILSREKFLKELTNHGLKFNQQTNSITVSGSFSGYSDVSKLQKLAQELEQLSALKCNNCGKIYCLTCLFNYAPRHATSGGKACFSCSGSVSHA